VLEFIDKIVIPFLASLYGWLGYGGVMVAMAIESAMIPLPSELILPFAGFLVSDPTAIEPLTHGAWDFWLVVIAARPVLRALTPTQVAWLVAGGLLYTIGVPFYVWSRRYAHAIWHVFVLGGAGCHLIAIADAISRH